MRLWRHFFVPGATLACVGLLTTGCVSSLTLFQSRHADEASRELISTIRNVGASPEPSDERELRSFIALVERSYYREVDLSMVASSVASDLRRAGSNDQHLGADALLKLARQKFLSQLDEHSLYFDAQEFGDFQRSLSGRFGGIGAKVFAHECGARIEPLPDSPAERAGLQSGDVVVRVGADDMAGQGVTAIAHKLRGVVGSGVSIVVIRDIGTDSAREIAVSLTREEIRRATIQSEIIGDIGYVALTQFTANTDDLLEAVIADWEQLELVGYILDLRHNPGGYLGQAVEVADMFLEQGLIVSVVSRDRIDDYAARPGNEVTERPLVILVDEATASSSEIVGEALSFYRRATIVGAPTYAKGTVQSLIGLRSGGGMKLTTARYRSPAGRFMTRDGVTPDVYRADDPDTEQDEALDLALRVIHQPNRSSEKPGMLM